MVSLSLCCVAVGAESPAKTLQNLGVGPVVLAVNDKSERFVVPYRLPQHATQGPDAWYLMRLHFAIVFEPNAGRGIAYVGGSTNGHAATQVEFSHRDSNSRFVHWSSVGLIQGGVSAVGPLKRTVVKTVNFLQFGGVRRGRNRLTVEIESLGMLRPSRIRVFPDTGVIRTRRGPALLRIEAESAPHPVSVGDAVEVPFTMRNVGGRPAPEASITAFAPDGVEIEGSQTQQMSDVRRIADGRFLIRPARAGEYLVRIEAVGGAKRAVDTVIIAADSGDGSAQALRWILGVSLIAAGLGLVAVRLRGPLSESRR